MGRGDALRTWLQGANGIRVAARPRGTIPNKGPKMSAQHSVREELEQITLKLREATGLPTGNIQNSTVEEEEEEESASQCTKKWR